MTSMEISGAPQNSLPVLSQRRAVGTACGKVILIGEHAAVDGYPALALPLKSQSLLITFLDWTRDSEILKAHDRPHEPCSWNESWLLELNDQRVSLPEVERERLSNSLERALQMLSDKELVLSAFRPQPVLVSSHIPLGAGMGGSAALSAALVRALLDVFGTQRTASEIARMANELDGVFHGRASGLDAATVVSDSIIRFRKNQDVVPVANGRGFWLLLVDTLERTPTRDMVARVAQLRARDEQRVIDCFSALGVLASRCESELRDGNVTAVGRTLQEAHLHLQGLEVSTPALDRCVAGMMRAGALGAKLTGGGGGGLAFGIFENKPVVPLLPEWQQTPHFLTFVPADKSH